MGHFIKLEVLCVLSPVQQSSFSIRQLPQLGLFCVHVTKPCVVHSSVTSRALMSPVLMSPVPKSMSPTSMSPVRMNQ
jgi:hypothetical protein